MPGARRDHTAMIRTIILLLAMTAHLAAADAPVPRVRPLTWAQPVIGEGIPGNFHRVSDVLLRSAQPDAAQLRVVERMGVRSVLTLREYHDDIDEAKGTSLKLLRVPLDAGKLDAAGLKRGYEALRDAEKPVLVHCWHGSDRTGAVVAVWRMVEDGWPREAAIDEFVHGGFGYHDEWFPELVDLLRSVDLSGFKRAAP